MSPHRDVSDRATPRSRTANAARHSAKRSVTRRKQLRSAQVVGLTAALAAAASASTVGVGHSAPTSQATALGQNQIDALTTARIERRQLATRDASRIELSENVTRKLQAAAAQQAKARDAKLAADRKLVQRRVAALAAAKAAATAKAQQAAAQKARAEAAERKAAAKAVAEAAPGAVLPTTGYRITATFGQGGSRWARNHTGTDFAAPTGTPVRSVMAGEVIAAEYAGAYGRQVKVRHTDGTVTSYSHMSEFTVSAGDSVSAGDQVGEIGMTGNTTGPHLHFEVMPDGNSQINPMPWLRDHGLNP